MAGAIDPNLWVSLARQWLAGMLAPSTGQSGYFARVNSDENNLEYVRPDVALAEVGLYTSAAVQVGEQTTNHGQITTIDTDTHTILEQTLQEGLCYVETLVSGIAASDGDYRVHSFKQLFRVTATTATQIALVDSDGGGSLTGTCTAGVWSGKTFEARATSAAGDGSTVWTATVRVIRHGT